MNQPITLLPREVPLGGQRDMLVRRTLPHRDLRTIGAFCFVDHYGPTQLSGPVGHPMVVPPHPHTGLQTVSWLLEGTVDHRDSLGSLQQISAGELNLMTAGRGIAHSEYSVGAPADTLHGVQLWVALPESERFQAAHFEHHPDLPVLTDTGFRVKVVMGSIATIDAPAATYSPLVCAEIFTNAGTHSVPLNPDFEHGLLALDRSVTIDGHQVTHSALHYLPVGRRTATITTDANATVLLVGGEPFTEELVMWWNFVGRSHDEIVAAREEWMGGSAFGVVAGDEHQPIPAPELPTVRLKPRPSRRA